MPIIHHCKNKKWNFWLGTILNNCLYIGMTVYFILYSIELFGYSTDKYLLSDNITLYDDQLIATKDTTYEPETTIIFICMIFHILGFVVTGIVFSFYDSSLQNKYVGMGVSYITIIIVLIIFPSLDSANVLKGGITEGDTNYHSGWSGYNTDDPMAPSLNCSDQDAKLVYSGNMTTNNCWVYLVPGTFTQTFSQCCGLWHNDTSVDMEQINQTYIYHLIYYCITSIAVIGLEIGFTYLKLCDFKQQCNKKTSRQILPLSCPFRKKNGESPPIQVVI